MCLLVVVSRLDGDSPLVVGANRDERLERPATAVTVLRASRPRVVGGRDDLAGGTWLAVNEHGVVAGLTNRPAADGRDPTKRSRGELPLAAAAHRRAESAVDDLVGRFRPADFNPAWLLVGDRSSLFALDMTGDEASVEPLGPGLHILENNPLSARSPKVEHVRALLGDAPRAGTDALVGRLRVVLADHTVPGATPDGTGAGGSGATPGTARRAETLAACVHAGEYGTRSSTLVVVPAAAEATPVVSVADGHPCTAPFTDAGALWRD